MSETSLVTVYIPTYNRRALLERAVESVLNQTYTNLEVIIVDDCSPDDTLDYLAQVAKKDSRVRYFQNEKNSGACVSRNKAIMEAKGEFITGLDDDDYFLMFHIEGYVKKWRSCSEEKNLVCLYPDLHIKTRSGHRIKSRISSINDRKLLLVGNYIGNQVFARASLFRENLFYEKMPAWQDLECWYRMLKSGIAMNAKLQTYIVDISHEHERITESKGDVIRKAHGVFARSNNLNKKESCVLYSQYFGYFPEQLKFHKLILMARCKFSFNYWLMLSKRYLSRWFN